MPFYPSATPQGQSSALGFFTETRMDDETTSWSDLTSTLMEEAESSYGPRDTRWFFTGIKFADINAPCIYFTGNRPFHVGIQLTRSAALEPRIAHYQLAHEIVHLLGPSESQSLANVLEEGMAAMFQQQINIARELGVSGQLAAYQAASDALAQLLAVDTAAVRKIRSVHPCIDKLTPGELQRIVSGVGSDLAETLCAPFARGQ